MSATVYILKSLTNGRFYIGSTKDLERRMREHSTGRSTYTRGAGPFELIFRQEYEELALARKIEFKLKRFKNKAIIEKIIMEGIIKLDS
jgi:putative endonuclease